MPEADREIIHGFNQGPVTAVDVVVSNYNIIAKICALLEAKAIALVSQQFHLRTDCRLNAHAWAPMTTVREASEYGVTCSGALCNPFMHCETDKSY